MASDPSGKPLVTFYKDKMYGGQAYNVYKAGSVAKCSDVGIPNDEISSLKVARYVTVTLYQHDTFTGETRTYTGPAEIDISNTWNDKMTSFRIVYTPPTMEFKVRCCKGLENREACEQYWVNDPSFSCDGIMADYCNSNPTDAACICFKSEIPSAHCFDQRCTNTNAYKTQFMRENVAKCPAYMDCRQYLSLSESAKNNILQGVSQQQHCTINTTNNTGGGSAPPTTTQTTTTQNNTNTVPDAGGAAPTSPAQSAMSTNVLIIILIVVVIAVGLAIVLLIGDDEDEYPPPYYPYM